VIVIGATAPATAAPAVDQPPLIQSALTTRRWLARDAGSGLIQADHHLS